MSFGTLIRKPTAFLPLGMSAVALLIVVIHLARYGITHDADEGTSAHLFQLLIVAELPIILAFMVKWLPIAAGPAIRVLALQALAIVVAFAPVAYFQL